MAQTFPLFALSLDRTSSVPLHRQLYEALRDLIQRRALPAGADLPSTRALAQDLGIARNTVTAAYDQLTAEGYGVARPGARTVVVDLPIRPLSAEETPPAQRRPLSKRGELMTRQPFHYGRPGGTAFHPGLPDAANFPFGLWGRLLTRRAQHARDALFGTYHVEGYPDLRRAIANYLKVARGVRCTPDQILITTGAQAGLDLLARLLLDPGDSVWMEEPGYYGAQSAFVAAGGTLAPLAVSEGVWDLTRPPARRLKLIYVTPSCQHPLGASMRMEQRLQLLEIAETLNAWIIEDDFDGEYRFQGQPIPAMQGFDHDERVIYVGTFAKILFPALRLGFIVLPPSLKNGIVNALSLTGQFAPLMLQAALADFIEQGHMARHLRRMRRIYASRRQTFKDLVQSHLGDWLTMVPGDSGIQMAGLLRHPISDHTLVLAARERGINMSALSMHYRHGREKSGLVMGYAASNEAAMVQGLETLRSLLPPG
ncbi:PLP-dependent aminotransferase family protein [Microvirga antarctica]|uniref:rhizopine catabolism transcriptional regulator MocR n=1 Tax=Microvirga antarctica TaxID=2819233 RepID=UPI001B3158D3|nr:PLP-dependent aminotransferase family protein [Microvirga antarctica]